MPDQPSAPPPKDEGSTSWKLIQENLARREFAPADVVNVDKVTSKPDGQVEVSGKDSAGIPVQRQIEPNGAFERIAAQAAQTSQQVKELHDQARKEASFWFWASAIAAVLGFLLVIIGIVSILFFQQSAAAVFSSVCGVLLEVVAKLFFNQSTAANKRVDEYRQDLLEAQSVNQAIDLCGAMADPEAKKRLMEEIIRKLLDAAMGQKSK
jgi:hypothetical protein